MIRKAQVVLSAGVEHMDLDPSAFAAFDASFA
jgi:hypothetical protein